MDRVQFQTLTWEGHDYDDPETGETHFRVYAFGRTEDGKSVCVKFPFKPFFYLGYNMKKDKPNMTHLTILKLLFNKILRPGEAEERLPCEKHEMKWCKECPEYIKYHKEWSEYTWPSVYKFQKHSATNLWGFQGGKKFPLVKMTFNTKRSMRTMANKLRFHYSYSSTFQNYESNLDPILRVLHMSGCSSTGWIEVPNRSPRDKETTCDIEIELNDHTHLTPLDRQDIAPFRTGSFDIECFSESGAFPQPTKSEDLVFQIAVTRQDYGRPDLLQRGLSIGPCQEARTSVYKDEKELLLGFKDLVHEWDLDIITGWNVFGFDFEYIMRRYEGDWKFMQEFSAFGRFRDERGRSRLTEKILSSSALGDNKMKMLPMSGRFVFDMMQLVKRDLNLDSYSLNNVSKDLLNDKKIDMPPMEIFDRWRRQNALEIGEVSEYCIKDTILPIQIMDKLKTIPNLIEMAKATWVPMSFLTERGQQIKVFSLMVKTATDHAYCIPTIDSKRDQDDEEAEKFQGATVLEPKKGAYYEPIVALDFASLYPSIMCAHNLCYSTYVFDKSAINKNFYDYEEFEIQGEKHYFVSKRKGEDGKVFALLPKILTDLKNFRSQAKKDMARTKGTPLEAVYNGKQLAYKVVMNSVYGFTGVTKGMLGLKPIASAVTCRGRQMIDETKATVEGNFEGAEVVYGDTDSVMVKFKLDDSLTVNEKIAAAWKLGEKAADMCVFPPPNELELEKVYCPYILYSKKRYAAKMWVQNKQGDMELEKVDIKGLQVIRRDQPPFIRQTGKKILDILLDSNDSAPALEYAMNKGKELLAGEVPLELLLETRSLKDDGFRTDLGTDVAVYETYNASKTEKDQVKVYNKRNLPHVWVRDRMWERQPGSEPRQGERVSFLVTDTGNPKHKLFEKADDPVYVEENKVKLDYKYYFAKLKKPVNDLMAPVVGEGDPLESLIPKITTVDQCETKEQIAKFSMKDLRVWCEKHVTLPKGISKWKKPDWVHQACVIKKINTTTALETMFSFDDFSQV
jgi:DNA polymerase delta subunit 1